METIPSYLVNSFQAKALNMFPADLDSITSRPLWRNNILQKKMLNSYLQSKQMAILNQKEDLKLQTYLSVQEAASEPASSKAQLILVNGYHCQGKHKMVQQLAKHAQSQGLLLKVLGYKLGELQTLETLLAQLRALRVPRNVIVVLVQQHGVDTLALMKSIDQLENLQIKCVITKVSLVNLFQNRNCLPNESGKFLYRPNPSSDLRPARLLQFPAHGLQRSQREGVGLLPAPAH